VQVLAKSLEAQVLQSDNSALAKDCRKEAKAINGRLLKLGRRDHAERRALRSELKLLLKEERKRQERAVADVISGSQACFNPF
jgi:DNA-binding ferritin-like protein (Dps family)